LDDEFKISHKLHVEFDQNQLLQVHIFTHQTFFISSESKLIFITSQLSVSNFKKSSKLIDQLYVFTVLPYFQVLLSLLQDQSFAGQ